MGYGFFKFFNMEIQQSESYEDLKFKLRKRLINMNTTDKKIFKQICFKIRFTKIKDQFSAMIDTISPLRAKEIYKPILETKSLVIGEEYFEEIYKWIPGLYRATDPKLIFANYKHGRSLRTLYSKMKDYEEMSCLILIKATNGSCFGVFKSRELINTHEHFIRDSDMFLFKLYPEEKNYPSTGLNDLHFMSTDQQLVFGCGDNGFGLLIKDEFRNGMSCPSTTFDNEVLCTNRNTSVALSLLKGLLSSPESINNFDIEYFEAFAQV